MAFPDPLKRSFGIALNLIQRGDTPLVGYKRFGDSGTPPLEQLSDDLEDTYRVLFVVLPSGVYVLHAFKKKSRKGIATPKQEIDLAKQRRQHALQSDTSVTAGAGALPPVDMISR